MDVAGVRTLAEAVEHHRLIEAGEDLATKFQWGVSFLQANVGPAAAGRAYVVAAPTGVGKSFFSLLVAASVDVPSLVVSLEDDLDELGRRSIRVPERVAERVLVTTPTRSTLSAITASIIQAQEDYGTRLVVIDYINRVRYDGEGHPFNEAGEIALNFDELVALARELDFALIVNAQVGRPREGNKQYGKAVWNIKGSSAIEEHAHTVVMLSEITNDTIEARVAKTKSKTKGGTARFRHDAATGWLTEMSAEEVATDDEDELF